MTEKFKNYPKAPFCAMLRQFFAIFGGGVREGKCVVFFFEYQFFEIVHLDAAFLLTVGSFLLTVELFYLQLTILAFSFTVGAFLLAILAFLLTVGAFLLAMGKCV